MVLTRFSDEQEADRGQTFILAAVLLSVIVLSGVIVVNGSFRATNDIAGGVEITDPQTFDVAENTDTEVQRLIITHNRNPDASFNDAFTSVETSLESNTLYNGRVVDIELQDTNTGTRVHGSYTPNTTDEDGVVARNIGEDAVGGVGINVAGSTITTNAANATTITHGSNTWEVYRSGSDEITVDVTGDGSETITVPDTRDTVLIDIGTGKVNGLRTGVYDDTANGDVSITNSEAGVNKVQWNAEFVTPSGGSAAVSNFDSNAAVYAVAYNLQVQSQRSHIKTSRVVTHAPTPETDGL